MAEEIQKLITLITNDLKEALDILFGIVEERIIWEPTGYPRESLKEIKRKHNIARKLYLKHFA